MVGGQEHERGEKCDAEVLERAGEAGAGDEGAVGPGQGAQEREGEERRRPDAELDARVGAQRVDGRPPRGEGAAEGEPPMKTARTIATAEVVPPKMRPNDRIQSDW